MNEANQNKHMIGPFMQNCANEYSSTIDLFNIETKTVGTLFAQKQHECFYVRTDKKTVADTRVEGV
ncbi:hypothetical protein RDWZM_007448 [Blomia tropicalis]|uniref:Uncharacterized protein n=1 Tax=Blomia tropicalis TaxID=40697 RepID=A0A9Q0RJ45_BLOTA|nr:hypothetical protein RDWZM_007448 [Blomia tropicalis]